MPLVIMIFLCIIGLRNVDFHVSYRYLPYHTHVPNDSRATLLENSRPIWGFNMCNLFVHNWYDSKSICNAPANNFRERRLAGVAILAHLNGLGKTFVSLPGLVKYLLVSASFVPLP